MAGQGVFPRSDFYPFDPGEGFSFESQADITYFFPTVVFCQKLFYHIKIFLREL